MVEYTAKINVRVFIAFSFPSLPLNYNFYRQKITKSCVLKFNSVSNSQCLPNTDYEIGLI